MPEHSSHPFMACFSLILSCCTFLIFMPYNVAFNTLKIIGWLDLQIVFFPLKTYGCFPLIGRCPRFDRRKKIPLRHHRKGMWSKIACNPANLPLNWFSQNDGFSSFPDFLLSWGCSEIFSDMNFLGNVLCWVTCVEEKGGLPSRTEMCTLQA